MSMARAPLQRIVIVGDGQTGLVTAIALAQALPSAEIDIVTGGGGFTGFADHACTALPFTNRLHDRIGLDEPRMVQAAGATHRLCVLYSDWGGAGTAAGSVYGAALPLNLRSAFARHWGGTARRRDGGLGALTLGEALAKAGRFAPPPPGADGPLGEFDYALRWDRQAYIGQLIQQASSMGVRHIASPMVAARQNEGGVEAITLADGSTLSADLWIDCGGTKGALISQMPGCARIDWSKRLPVRRIVIARGNRGRLALEDRIAITKAGWVCQTMGTDGAEAVLGLAPGLTDEDAHRFFGTDAVHALDVAPVRLDKAWLGNVIALGDAAMEIEPLAWTNLDFAHRMVDLLLQLLPGKDLHPLERQEFNRRFAMMAEANADFVASHYATPVAQQLFGTPEQSEALALCLQQFTQRGKLPFIEEAPLAGREWHGVLRALGLEAGSDVIARAEDAAAHRQLLGEHQQMLEMVVNGLPPYEDWYRSVAQG